MPIPRPISLRVPLTAEEHGMLRALAEHEGVTATTLVRSWVRREYAVKVGSTQKPRRRPRLDRTKK